MMKNLSGYKTYAVAVAAGLLAVAKMLGYVDDETYNTLLTILGAGGLATMRAAVAKGKRRTRKVAAKA